MRIVQIFYLLIALFMNAQIVFGVPIYKWHRTKFLESLASFVEKNELGSEEFAVYLRKQGLTTRFLSKGGLGIVTDSHFCVSVKSDSNRIIHQGIVWTGANREKQEVVYSDGVNIESTSEGITKKQLVVIIFTPRRIYFVNYRDHQGGYYDRL